MPWRVSLNRIHPVQLLAGNAYSVDQGSKNRYLDMPLEKAARLACQMLTDDSAYQKEYEQFVDNMSYARTEDRISFEGSVSFLQGILLRV